VTIMSLSGVTSASSARAIIPGNSGARSSTPTRRSSHQRGHRQWRVDSSSSSSQSGSIGVGFAIPANLAKRVRTRSSERSAHTRLLGASVVDVTATGSSARVPTQVGRLRRRGGQSRCDKPGRDHQLQRCAITGEHRPDSAGAIPRRRCDQQLTYERDGKSTTVNVTVGTLKYPNNSVNRHGRARESRLPCLFRVGLLGSTDPHRPTHWTPWPPRHRPLWRVIRDARTQREMPISAMRFVPFSSRTGLVRRAHSRARPIDGSPPMTCGGARCTDERIIVVRNPNTDIRWVSTSPSVPLASDRRARRRPPELEPEYTVGPSRCLSALAPRMSAV